MSEPPKRKRSRSPRDNRDSRDHDLQPIPYCLAVNQQILSSIDNPDFIASLKSKTGIAEVQVKADLGVSEVPFGICSLMDTEKSKKIKSLMLVSEQIIRSTNAMEVNIFLPEALGTQLTGRKSNIVRSLCEQMGTEVLLQAPVPGMPTERMVKICGKTVESIGRTANEVYKIVQDRRRTGSPEHKPHPPSNFSKVKLVLDRKVAQYLEDRNDIPQRLQQEFAIRYKLFTNEGPPLKETQCMIQLSGRPRDLRPASDFLISKLCRFLNDKRFDDSVYLLMPSNLANKLIGIKGTTIRELMDRSRCHIKVLFDRDHDRDPRTNVLVLLSGNTSSKASATVAIIEKIESFKHHDRPDISAPKSKPVEPDRRKQPAIHIIVPED